MKVIGIDPSIRATGIAWPDGTTTTSRSKAAGDLRLLDLYNDLTEGLRDPWAVAEPVYAVIEDLPKHAHGAGLTGRAQGVVRLALMQLSIPYVTVPPATLKKLYAGKGNASKEVMSEAYRARNDWYSNPGIEPPGMDDNQVDAAALRWVGMQRMTFDPDAAAPSFRNALAVIDWYPWGMEWKL